MTSPEPSYQTYVLTPEVVRAAISDLASRKIVFFFVAYLQLRSMAVREGKTTDLRPHFKAGVGKLLEMPGGPPNKPYYKPFGTESHSGLDTFWFNKNLAGSWSPRSIRDPNQAARQVVDLQGPKGQQTYSLKANHARQALTHLLDGTPVPSFSLGAFLLRDFAFLQLPAGGLHPKNVSDAFMRMFMFLDDEGHLDVDASVLFDARNPDLPDTWYVDGPTVGPGDLL